MLNFEANLNECVLARLKLKPFQFFGMLVRTNAKIQFTLNPHRVWVSC